MCTFFGNSPSHSFLRRGAAIAIVPLLTACAGGSGAGVTQFAGYLNYPTNGKVSIDGQAMTGQYTANLSTGAVSVGAISGPNSANALDTVRNGQSVSLRIQAPGSNVTWDTDNGDSSAATGGVIGYVSADGTKLGFQANPSVLGYLYQTHGSWITGYNTGSGTIGVGTFGSRTPTGSMPVTGSAAYSGTSLGFLVDTSGQPYSTVSAINIATDFSSVTLTSTGTTKVSTFTGTASGASNLDFSGTGPVFGNQFSATISGSGVFGNAAGLFYGPNANEAGGTFLATGTGGTYAGAFGSR